MTGIKAMSPFDPLAVPQSVTPATLEDIQQNRRIQLDKLQPALEQMHKRIVETNNKVRARGRQVRGQKQGTRMAQIEVGDFVLYADVWAHSRSKLCVRWCGPAQVTAATSNWIFKIKNLVTGDEREAHASRLKFYSDSSLEVSEELLQHVAHNSEGHVVSKFLRASYDTAAKSYKLLVRWRGLSEQEDSWEPVQVMLEDVPAAVKAFIADHADESIVRKLADAHGISID
ncbi:hypothetical protein PF010_g21445 [Phytophthora fragariae]|uniref:Chromo domain-containing protein n=1 Tax=Phytophthora fragariae TaxID=53985 RepID=A0A6G0N8K4_9STRA|nr:hypothetical protein PF010_g21445 [Phytophthora fragariae]KAE9196259.1 hypothetical protein PF004_g20191 [Phytophthora fragariae]